MNVSFDYEDRGAMFSYLKETQACLCNCLQLNEEYYQEYERLYVLALKVRLSDC